MRSAFVAALLAAVLAVSLRAAEPPLLVRDLGEFDALDIRGTKFFSARQIKQGLQNDFDFLIGAHPRAPFAGYLKMLEQRISLGYQHKGCPDVKVTAALADSVDKVVITVEEGTQYLCGEIEVLGTRQADAQRLVAWLRNNSSEIRDLTQAVTATKGAVPVQAAALKEQVERAAKAGAGRKPNEAKPGLSDWKPDRPATFVPKEWERWLPTVLGGLQAQGLPAAQARLEVVADAQRKTATLRVHITDEGAKSTLGEIQIEGLKRHTQAEVMKYLEIKTGDGFSSYQIPELSRRIEDSARFLWHSISLPEVPAGAPQPLVITLRELESGPKLGEAFSEREEILLKLSDWIAEFPTRKEALDLAVRLDATEQTPVGTTLRLRITPQGNFHLRATAMKDTHAVCDLESILTEERFGIMSHTRRSRLEFERSSMPEFSRPTLRLMLAGSPKPEETANFSFGFQFHPGSQNPHLLDTGLSRALAVHSANLPDWEYVLQATDLKMTRANSEILIERATGRLRKLQVADARAGSIELSIHGDGLTKSVNDFISRSERIGNSFNPQVPLSSTLSFVLPETIGVLESLELRASEIETLTQMQAWLKLAAAALEPRLDEFMTYFDTAKFDIPAGTSVENPNPYFWVAKLALPINSRLFPRKTSAWTVGREVSFLLAGRGTYSLDELNRVRESLYTGPVGHAYAAAATSLLSRELAAKFAKQGLRRLDARSFRRDCEVLLAEDGLLGECLLSVASSVQRLTPAEVESLTTKIPPAIRPHAVAALLKLRESADQPLDVALYDALEVLWEPVIKPYLEGYLTAMAALARLETAAVN